MPPEAQAPAAAQPPIAPPADRSTSDDDVNDDPDITDRGWGWRTWVVRIATGTGAALLPLVLGAAVILGVKERRRRRRRRAATASDCVRGVWANTTDDLVDAGMTIHVHWTDDRIAVAGADIAPMAQHEMRRLAALATAATFGPPADHTSAANATRTEANVAAAIASQMTRWQRLRWRLSLRSLRPSTRSPVIV